MADTKISAITAAVDLTSMVLVGEALGVNKSYPVALFDTRYQASSANLTSWAAITRATGFDTFVATPSSANLKSLITDETGSGALVFTNTPALITPDIGAATGTSLALTGGLISSISISAVNVAFVISNSVGSSGMVVGSGGNTNVAFDDTHTLNINKYAKANIDNGSFSSGTNLISLNNNGFLAISSGSLGRGAPVTKTADFTVAATENWLINNKAAATCTVTLPTASSFTGREITIKTIQAFTVVSASSNVVPLAGGAAATAILAATAGKWTTLVSDGTNWVIMAGN